MSSWSSWKKCHQILFFFVTLLIWENKGVSCQITIAVLFNGAESSNPTSSIAIKKSFEKIPSMLDIVENVQFVYKDLNSTFCDLGTFLAFMDEILTHEVVVLLLDDCKCQKRFLFFLDILRIKSISSCERPLFTVNSTSAVIQKVHKERQLYLIVSADACGVEFYQDLSFELERQKLKLHNTLWVGVEDGKENQLKNELERIAQNMNDNLTSGVTFVLGFLSTDDFRVKSLISLARLILEENFDKILWLFPVIHLDFSNMHSFLESSQVFTFQESNSEALYCNCHNQMCALRLVLKKTSNVLKSCWKKDRLHHDNLTEYGRNTTEIFVYSVQKVEKESSVKSRKCQISLNNCFTDVVQITTDQYIEEKAWKRIATWNGETIQSCLPQEESNNAIGIINSHTVFRTPIVEYFPYVIKHELSRFDTKCPIHSLPCYEQHQKSDNTTVINYADKYCCSGWTVDILIYLSQQLSCEFELYFQAEKLYGVYDNITGQWNGIIQDIISGKGDISVDLTLGPARCAVLDCSVGYLFDGINVIVRLEFSEADSPSDEGSFKALVGNFQLFLNPFHVNLFVVVLMMFNAFLFLIWGTDKICLSYKNGSFGEKREKFTLLESMSYVWATAFGRDVGDSKKPLTLSARYLSSWLAFLSLIFVNVYVARLMAEMVKEEPDKPFTSLRDPEILNKHLKLGVVKGTSMEAFFHNTRDRVLKDIFENSIKENLLPSLDEGVEAVKNGTLDGFIADTVSLVTILNEDPNCSLSLLGKDVSVNAVGFMFRQGWPWAKEFKLQELAMNENKRNEDWWKKKQSYPVCKIPSSDHPQLTANNMSGFFLVLIFAIAYCCFLLLVENIHSLLLYRYRNSTGDWNVQYNHETNVTVANLHHVGESLTIK